MRGHDVGRECRRILFTLTGFAVAVVGTANAQAPPTPAPAVPPPPPAAEVGNEASAAAPPVANPPAAGAPATPREAALEDRIRQLESMVGQLSGQVRQIQAPPDAGGRGGVARGAGGGPTQTGPTAGTPGATGVNAGTVQTPSGGALAPGQSMPPNPAPSARFQMPPTALNKPLSAKFGPGFEWKTEDEEYVLQFHNLSQFDFRGYQQGGQNPVRDTFAVPRQWFMFSGRIGKPYEYFVSLQNGFDTVSLLDAFINVHFDDRIQFRLGRFKTPFTYEFYTLPIQGLITPERSLFFNNFALNRQTGAMVWGRVLNKTTDYAVGIFNTFQNGFVDQSDGKDFLGFLNFHPFGNLQGSLIENLNIGGSVDVGDQFNATQPQILRTQVATSGSNVLGIPFLTFNNNVRQAGQHTLWDLHAAYYYRHLSLIAEWQSGFQDYAQVSNLNQRTHLPVDSYYVQAGYFLTGETVSQRNVVRPLRPFDIRAGKRGPGAIELSSRYNYLHIDPKVFSSGLSDQNQSANSLYTVDTGFNWYWTTYIKWQFLWEHAVFNQSVVFAPGREQKTSDTFWVRFQLYF